FEKSGIFPPTDEPAVSYLLKKKLKTYQAIDPALSSLLPAENRFPMASDTARDVGNRHHDILSSPTLRGLESIRKIVNEAIVLEDIVRNHVEDRPARIEKRYHQRKRGKRARPVGDYIHNVSLQELRDQHAEFVKAGDKAQQRSQLRNLRSFTIRQMEEIKAEWRENKEVIVNGITKKMQFKQWLKYTGKDLAPEVRETIRDAGFAAKPLSAVDLSGLLYSDDSIDFTLTQPPEDADEDEDIDLSDKEDLVMPSSPPCLPDDESPFPTAPSTPCPPQHHAQFRDALINLIEEERAATEASHRLQKEQETP
ncbi:hypothetical protein FOXB_02809, partial [Fusarium oxysporum f. sp. conglutinans Fo5176]